MPHLALNSWVKGYIESSTFCAFLLHMLHYFHGLSFLFRCCKVCFRCHPSMHHGLIKCKSRKWLWLLPNAYAWRSYSLAQPFLFCLTLFYLQGLFPFRRNMLWEIYYVKERVETTQITTIGNEKFETCRYPSLSHLYNGTLCIIWQQIEIIKE